MSGLELARAKAWAKERPNHNQPPQLNAASLQQQLQQQAAEHGLANYTVLG